MKIISIQGPRAVGKSSLIDALKDNSDFSLTTMKEFGYEERKKRDLFQFDLTIKAHFLRNQEIFFQGEYLRYKKIMKISTDYLVLDRGPEDTLCFSEIYPKIINKGWNIQRELQELKNKYIKYESDIIIYLDASIDIIKQRQINDNRKIRSNFSDYISSYYKLEKEYFLKIPTTIYINTMNSTTKNVYEIVVEHLIKLNIFKG